MRRSVLFVVLAALALAACGGDDTAATADPDATTATTATEQAYLDFTAEDVRGGQVTGSDFAGEDLVLWFWAPW